MELFDLLETRVVELLGQIDTLREENKTLQEKVNALDEENKTLKESLEQEQHTKEEINGRIDTLLSTIKRPISVCTAFSSMSSAWTFPSVRMLIPLVSSGLRTSSRSSMRD